MKHLNTQICSAVFGLVMATGTVWAEKAVVVVGVDGTQRAEMISDIDRINIGNSALTIVSTDNQSTTINYSDIDRVLIGEEWKAVQDITAPGELAVWPTMTTTTVNISGASAGDPIKVFNLDGAAVIATEAADGLTTIDISAQPAGIYILTVHNQSVKIVKN
ncbi:MAG: T9SS type A sorting domain-containing protein [Muribaculaceae bacterium]|nr:T9SS type A sorting domain-containing protein [Muribaculaceae bacterium]